MNNLQASIKQVSDPKRPLHRPEYTASVPDVGFLHDLFTRGTPAFLAIAAALLILHLIGMVLVFRDEKRAIGPRPRPIPYTNWAIVFGLISLALGGSGAGLIFATAALPVRFAFLGLVVGSIVVYFFRTIPPIKEEGGLITFLACILPALAMVLIMIAAIGEILPRF